MSSDSSSLSSTSSSCEDEYVDVENDDEDEDDVAVKDQGGLLMTMPSLFLPQQHHRLKHSLDHLLLRGDESSGNDETSGVASAF